MKIYKAKKWKEDKNNCREQKAVCLLTSTLYLVFSVPVRKGHVVLVLKYWCNSFCTKRAMHVFCAWVHVQVGLSWIWECISELYQCAQDDRYESMDGSLSKNLTVFGYESNLAVVLWVNQLHDVFDEYLLENLKRKDKSLGIFLII